MADVSIDYAVVGKVAASFNTSSDQLRQVTETLRNVAALLELAALVGEGGKAASVYLQALADHANRLSLASGEVAKDVYASMKALQDGDTSGSARFNR